MWYYTDAMGNNVRLPESPSYSVSSDGLYYAQVNGQSTRVYQDGIMVEGVTESGSKNEEVVSARNTTIVFTVLLKLMYMMLLT